MVKRRGSRGIGSGLAVHDAATAKHMQDVDKSLRYARDAEKHGDCRWALTYAANALGHAHAADAHSEAAGRGRTGEYGKVNVYLTALINRCARPM